MMPGVMFSGLGRVVVPVDDQEGALAFYRDILGFVVLHDSETSGYRYLHVGVPGQVGVGLWLMPGERQTGDRPLLVLYTDDLKSVRARLAERSVELWAERDEPGSRSLHFRDPGGNVIIAAEPS
jgi:catechol 2,3-dioxygenase-like lactoylglutathione lyase family enzyme